MGTVAFIAAKCSDGKYRRIICKNDGYLGYAGRVLHEAYKDQEKVDALMQLGDLYILGASLEHTTNDWRMSAAPPPVDKLGMITRCVVYSDGFKASGVMLDTNFDEYDSEDDLIDSVLLGAIRADYNYYFKDGQWYFLDWIDESAFVWVPLGSDDARRIELERR